MMPFSIGWKSSITYNDSHDYAKIKICSDDDFPQKTLTMYNVAILIIKTFLQKCSCYLVKS